MTSTAPDRTSRRAVLAGLAGLPLASLPLARPAVAQPAASRTLRFVPQSHLPLLDPMFASEIVMNYGFTVFDTLFATDAHGVIQPQMAEGYAVSDDRLVWTIRLREGLWFHDGTPVRAADCAASLQRWSKMDTFGQILAKSVERWAAIDDRTMQIRLTKPFPLLLDAIGKSQSRIPFILPERLAQTDPFKPITEAIGSGPYRFAADEFVSGSRVVYQRFDRYLPRPEPSAGPTGGKVAFFPRIEWQVIPDSATASAALQAGEVDWWEQPQPDLYPVLQADRGITLQIDNPDGHISFMRMNHLQPPFNDVRVRRAVLMAVNQEDYMRAVLGDDASLWRVCRSQFPCSSPYGAEDDGQYMRGDIAAGRKLLAASGYAGQTAVVLNPTDNIYLAPLGEITADTMRRIGMTVELATTDWASVVQRRANRGPVEQGGWSALHSSGPSTLYANPAVNPLLRGIGIHGWPGWWTNPQAEALVQDWVDAPDAAARQAAGRALNALAMADVAIVPLGQWQGRTAYRRTITGVTPGVAPFPWNVRPAL
jgi:peptide/nickel transport system substrate-binding protein